MKGAYPPISIPNSVNHDVASGGTVMRRGSVDVSLVGIRDVQSEMVVAVRFVEIDRIHAFRCALIAFEFFRADRLAAKNDAIRFERSLATEERQPTRRLFHKNAVDHRVQRQGIEVQMRRDHCADNCMAKHDKKQEKQFQQGPKPCYICPIGRRARGSRSFVVAVLGEVTNGPPSSGALSENATSGISLGKPSSGNSFRSGK
jgi:hypothetical protein